ncbi:MAG: GNAT family N-acetyltransferase [Nostoc sp.]|uniref:GNAT family N-acetyltransferase n=1 Tax=Nostoc sp. TaxID=1180 RepID=UPI002FF6355B
MEFQLRQANKDDWDFIWSLRVVTMKDMIAQSYGWDENIQRSYAQESLTGKLILVYGVAVGVITLSDWGEQLHLTWLAIVPQMQRQGLGSNLIQYCQQQAIKLGKPLTLQVLRNNPAVSLYRRFGFEISEQNTSDKLLMQWNPKSS